MQIKVYLEIPKNSPVKYEIDPESGKTKEEFVFKNGFVYKYNYGFMLNTLAEDGDPLDIIIWDDAILLRDTIYDARPIGIIKLLDRGVGDPKIIAVPIDSKIKTMQELGPDLKQELTDFFAEIARQKNKTIVVQDVLGEDQAIAEIIKSVKRYKN